MKQVALKGDKYKIWENTYDEPYPEKPDTATVFKVSEPQDLPDTGEELAFCNGKPVVFVGYEFSKMKKDTYFRGWEYNEDGEITGPKEEKTGTDEVKVQGKDGSTFVFVDGQPMILKDGGVEAKGDKWAMIDGKLEKVGSTQASGQFTECTSHIYVES
jgi:hypothetical protein